MIKSYFFVPANNKKFLKKAPKLKADFLVYDLEDSITSEDLDLSIKNLTAQKSSSKHLVRIPSSDFIRDEYFIELVKAGYTKFIVPKAKTVSDLSPFNGKLVTENNLKFILLIESPGMLLNLKDALEAYPKEIVAIALGSHDYVSELGSTHTEENLKFARDYVLNHGKAYEKEVIDIASMDIKNKSNIKDEILYAFKSGYNSKFFIHPFQLDLLSEVVFFEKKELEFAKSVMENVGDSKDFSPFVIDGQIIEKPHINKFSKMIKWSEDNEL